jgi:hypothetical protein
MIILALQRAASSEGTKATDAYGTRAERSSILRVIVPTDGTSAATGGNGDFGTSPIFGQLSDKPLLASILLCGAPDVKNNGRLRNYALIRFDAGLVR